MPHISYFKAEPVFDCVVWIRPYHAPALLQSLIVYNATPRRKSGKGKSKNLFFI